MTKYHKVEINKNLAKKLFKKDLEKFEIDLKKKIMENFLGIHTNYKTLRKDLEGSVLTEEVISNKVEKSKLLFFITNGKWINKEDSSQELPLLSIGDYQLTSNMEEGFSVMLKQILEGEKDYFTFYTKDDIAVIKKILGSKSILGEIEINDELYQVNEVKSFIKWDTMLKLQEQVEASGNINPTWGQKEIDKKRELILNKILKNEMTSLEEDYIYDLRKKDEELYIDMIYDIIFENIKVSEDSDKKELRLREPAFFNNLLSKIINAENYSKFEPNRILGMGLGYVSDIAEDVLELRAKFLNKAYKQILEDESKNTSGLNKQQIYMELSAFAKLSKSLHIFGEFEDISVKKSLPLPKMKVLSNTDINNEAKVFKDIFNTIEITKEERIQDEVSYVDIKFKNQLFEKNTELKLLRKNGLEYLLSTKETKLLSLENIKIEQLVDGRKWYNYRGIYEYPTDTREKLLIALNFLNEKISEKNINYSLIKKIFVEINNSPTMKENLINMLYANAFNYSKANLGINQLMRLEKIRNVLDQEITEDITFQVLNKMGKAEYEIESFDIFLKMLKSFESVDIKKGLNILENMDDDHPREQEFYEKLFAQKDYLLVGALGNTTDPVVIKELIVMSLERFKDLLSHNIDGRGFRLESKTLMQSVVELPSYRFPLASKELVQSLLKTSYGDNEFKKQIIQYLLRPITIDGTVLSIILGTEGYNYLFNQNCEWGQLVSKKLSLRAETINGRLRLIKNFFDEKYDLLLSNTLRSILLFKTIQGASTSLSYDQKEFENFKSFLNSVKETHPLIFKETIESLTRKDILSKKKALDIFNKLGIINDIEENILKTKDFIFMTEHLTEKKINDYFDENPDILKEIKSNTLAKINNVKNELTFKKLMNFGYIETYEYDYALENYLKNKGGYNIFPKYGFEIYNRNLLKKHAVLLEEIIKNQKEDFLYKEGIAMVDSFLKGFSKEIQREDATIEIIATLLRTVNANGEYDIFDRYKNDVSNIYKAFGETKYEIISALLNQKNESLENVLSKIKFADMSKDDVAKKRVKI